MEGTKVKRKPLKSELTWNEKHPQDYMFRPTATIKRLREKANGVPKSDKRDKLDSAVDL
jgi:hypothetical protein